MEPVLFAGARHGVGVLRLRSKGDEARRVAGPLRLGQQQVAVAEGGLAASRRIIDVDAPGITPHVAKICAARVEILHEVIPRGPPPHLTRRLVLQIRLELDDQIVPNLVIRQEIGPAASGDRLLLGFALPAHDQNIAVWHRLEVVVCEVRLVRQRRPRPHDLAVPRHLLHDAGGAARLEARRVDALGAVAQQVARRQQIGCEDWARRAPAVDLAAVLVEEVRLSAGAEEREPRLHFGVVALEDADGAFVHGEVVVVVVGRLHTSRSSSQHTSTPSTSSAAAAYGFRNSYSLSVAAAPQWQMTTTKLS